MKKQNLRGKLALNRETLKPLLKTQLDGVIGGADQQAHACQLSGSCSVVVQCPTQA